LLTKPLTENNFSKISISIKAILMAFSGLFYNRAGIAYR